jgi:protein gp37
MPQTKISRTDHSWPMVNGCRRADKTCERCYAEDLTATRLRHLQKYEGLATYPSSGPRWTGETRLWERSLHD